jgi:hypothetical protein
MPPYALSVFRVDNLFPGFGSPKSWHSIDPGLRNLFRVFPDRIRVGLQDREFNASADTMFYYKRD